MDLVTTWEQAYEVGARAFVAGDAVNLRTQPVDGAVVVELPLGVPVDVLEVGPAGKVGEREARWLRVKAADHEGWLFGGVLTTARLETDLDGDGAKEVAVLAFRTTDRHDLVRLREDGGTVRELDLGAWGRELRLSTTTAAETGIPLVVARDPGEESCGSGDQTWWVSYVAGKAQIAVVGHHWFDAPAYDSLDIAFAPPAAATRTATVNEGDGGGEKKSVEALVLRDGVFVP